MKRPTLPAEGASQVECGWVGCGIQLPYNEEQISQHFNETHKKKSQEVICQWEVPGGYKYGKRTCGKTMLSRNLLRHILGVHTILLVARCEWCGEGHRRDAIIRHKNVCEKRKEILPDSTFITNREL